MFLWKEKGNQKEERREGRKYEEGKEGKKMEGGKEAEEEKGNGGRKMISEGGEKIGGRNGERGSSLVFFPLSSTFSSYRPRIA